LDELGDAFCRQSKPIYSVAHEFVVCPVPGSHDYGLPVAHGFLNDEAPAPRHNDDVRDCEAPGQLRTYPMPQEACRMAQSGGMLLKPIPLGTVAYHHELRLSGESSTGLKQHIHSFFGNQTSDEQHSRAIGKAKRNFPFSDELGMFLNLP